MIMNYEQKFYPGKYTDKIKGRRGIAPVKEAPAVYSSEKFLYAYGTQANANQVKLLYLRFKIC